MRVYRTEGLSGFVSLIGRVGRMNRTVFWILRGIFLFFALVGNSVVLGRLTTASGEIRLYFVLIFLRGFALISLGCFVLLCLCPERAIGWWASHWKDGLLFFCSVVLILVVFEVVLRFQSNAPTRPRDFFVRNLEYRYGGSVEQRFFS